jgi:hypothetical protein
MQMLVVKIPEPDDLMSIHHNVHILYTVGENEICDFLSEIAVDHKTATTIFEFCTAVVTVTFEIYEVATVIVVDDKQEIVIVIVIVIAIPQDERWNYPTFYHLDS